MESPRKLLFCRLPKKGIIFESDKWRKNLLLFSLTLYTPNAELIELPSLESYCGASLTGGWPSVVIA